MSNALRFSLLSLLVGCGIDLPDLGLSGDGDSDDNVDVGDIEEIDDTDGSADVEDGEDGEDTEDTSDTEDPLALSVELTGPSVISAGEEARFAVVVTDEDGTDHTEQSTVEVSVMGPEGAMDVAGLSFFPLVAGEYTVQVSVSMQGSTAQAAADLSVEPGAPYSLSLSLSADSIDPGDAVDATVSAWDIGGNVVDPAAVVLSVSPSDGVDVDGLSMVALLDGNYTVTATLPGDVSAAASLLVDGNGPSIVLDDPGRAAFVSAGVTEFTGAVTDDASAVSSVSFGSAAVTLGSGGSFAVSATLATGVNLLRMDAIDADGNETDLVAAVLAGDFEDGTFEGLRVRTGVDAVSSMVDGVSFPLDDAEDALLAANPLSDSFTDDCAGALVDATDLSVGGTAISVAPGAGVLEVTVSLSDLEVGIVADVGTWVEATPGYEVCYETTVSDAITVETVTVTVDVALAASGGAVIASMDGSTDAFVGVDAGLAGDAGLDVEALLADFLVPLIEDAAVDAVQSGVTDLDVSESFELAGVTVDLSTSVADVEVDAGGIELVLDTDFSSDASSDAPGSLVVQPAAPDLGDESLTALSVDALNRMLHLSWEAGAIDTYVSHEELGLSESVVGLLFEGASTLSLDITAQLPPVAFDQGAGQDLSVDLGELNLEAWGMVSGTEQRLGTVSMHLSGTITPAVSNGALVLQTNVTDMEVDVTQVEGAGTAAAESLESLLGVFGGSLGTDLLGDISVPLPSALGTPASAEMSGDGWLVITPR